MARSCIYCGGSPLTKEHIFGDAWMRSLLGEAKYDLFHESAYGESPPHLSNQWEGTGPDVVVKCACAPCNNGWMARLDSAAHPLIEAMVHGQPARLASLNEIHLVAAWAIKVGMCLASKATAALPRRDEAGQLRAAYVIPAAHRVRLAATDIAWPNGSARTVQILAAVGVEPSGNEGYTSTFHVGHLVLQVFAPPPGAADERGAIGWDQYVVPVWPVRFEPVHWPPAQRIPDIETLEEFAKAYVRESARHASGARPE